MDLSKELLDNKKYYDWVVTTAFYSSIHFLEDKLLPSNINSQECKNIADVRRAFSVRGRHLARLKLVQAESPLSISTKYKWLDDKSRYSRYTTYKVTAAEADKAMQYLNFICKDCS